MFHIDLSLLFRELWIEYQQTNFTYIAADDVANNPIAAENDDFVILARKHVGRADNVHPLPLGCQPLNRGFVVALPRYTSLDPGLVILHGDIDHLQLTIKQLGAAHCLRAVEMKALVVVDCAPSFQRERERDVDVAAPRGRWAVGPR